jgi:AraC-like DNA-binding protein
MRYQEFLPSVALRPYVDCYWLYEIDAEPDQVPVQRCLPLGTAELIIQLNAIPCFINSAGDWMPSERIYFTGLYSDTAYWKTTPSNPMFGIRMKAESFAELFDIPGTHFFNAVMDAEAVLGQEATGLFNRMLGVNDPVQLVSTAEGYLFAKLNQRKNRRNYVAEACQLIRSSNGILSIDTLSETLFISKRQLQRSFKELCGTSPKTFQRIIRFRNAYRYARQKGADLRWSDVSYEYGYADQAHFIRDFKEFTGGAPSILNSNTESFFQTLEVVS